MLPLSQDYLLSKCEIKSIANRFLGTGYIAEIEEDHVLIKNDDMQLITLMANSDVKVNIHNSKLGFKTFKGIVYTSSAEFLCITELVNLATKESRVFYRVDTGMNGKIYQLSDKNSYERKLLDGNAVIQNISLGGLLLSTACDYSLGDEFYIEFKLDTNLMSFACRVQRVDEIEGTGQRVYGCERIYTSDRIYGCEFLDSSERQKDVLWKFIMDQQRLMIRKMRQ